MADIYDEMEWLKRSHEIRDNELIINQSERLDKLFKFRSVFSDSVYRSKTDELGDDFRRERNAWEAQKQFEIQEERRRIDAWKAYYKEQGIKAWARYQHERNHENVNTAKEQKSDNDAEKVQYVDWRNLREKQNLEFERLMYDTFKQFSEDTRGLDGVKAEELPHYIIENLDMSRDSIKRMAIRHYLELYDFDKNPIFDKVMDEERQYLKSPEYNQIRETQKKIDEQEKRLKSMKERDDSYNQNEETERIRQKMIKMQQNKRALDRDNTDELR